MNVERFGSGAKWEPIVGYSRAVRAGPFVVVAGTTATGDDGAIVGEKDAYAQTRQAFLNVKTVLERAGSSLEQVIQTRMYVTDIDRWEEVGRAHGDLFGDIRPVTAMVEVSRLIDPAMLVEVEAIAYSPETGK